MRILEELEKRKYKEDNIDALIGAELKLRRNSLSKTLESVSGNTCSVSYLSKVENNEIKANPILLKELCKKVNLKPESIKLIKDGKEIFGDVIEAFFKDDIEKLEEIYNSVFDMKNYRSKIMKLFYLVKVKNIRVANRIIKELEKIISSIQLTDLIILIFIEAMFKYLINEKLDAFKMLKAIVNYDQEFKYIDVLAYEKMTNILLEINSRLYLIFSGLLKDKYIKYSLYTKLESLEQNKIWYLIQNGHYELAKEFITKANFDTRQMQLVISAALDEEIQNIQFDEYRFGEMIYLYHFDKLKFDVIYNSDEFILKDSEYQLITALYLKDRADNYFPRLCLEFLPFAISTKNSVLVEYFYNLQILEWEKKSKYRRCLDITKQIIEFRKECERYC